MPGPPLAVVRAREELIDQLFVGVRRRILARTPRPLPGVGGRPIRSKYSRRISVRRSARGEGDRPLPTQLREDERDQSGFALRPLSARISGTLGRRTGCSAHQSYPARLAVVKRNGSMGSVPHFAPPSIHSRSSFVPRPAAASSEASRRRRRAWQPRQRPRLPCGRDRVPLWALGRSGSRGSGPRGVVRSACQNREGQRSRHWANRNREAGGEREA